MSSESLQKKTLNAFLWSSMESIGVQGVRFVTGIVLARLLSPEEFGLIAMAMVFVNVTQPFFDGGFAAALVQKASPKPTDYNSVFYFNIFMGLLVASLIFFSAPWIATFYNQPILISMTRALSAILVINSFGLIQSAVLTKHINFKIQTKAVFFSGILSGIFGIGLALIGFGVWSLVCQQILNAALTMVCLWLLNDWRPSLIFSFQSLRAMFPFGSRLMVSGVLSIASESLYSVVIGRVLSAKDLGLFVRAQTLEALPANSLSMLVSKVIFPVFSSIQDDIMRVKSALQKVLKITAFLSFPLMIGMAAASHAIILVLLGEKWIGCIPYLQLLCVEGLLNPIAEINSNLLMSLGRSDLYLRLRFAKMLLIFINISLTWRFGISALILGMIAISVILFSLSCFYAGRSTDYKLTKQLRDLLPYLFLALVMGIVVYGVKFLFVNKFITLSAQIATGSLLYIGLCGLLRMTAFTDLWQILSKISHKKEFMHA
jgi:teichuronic acid exporter